MSQLRKPNVTTGRPAMPEFADLGAEHPDRFAAVDEWRAKYCPARPGRSKSDASDGTDTGERKKRVGEDERIDVAAWVQTVADPDQWALDRALIAAQVADGLYERACETGNPVKVRQALENANRAAIHLAAVRARFLKLQEESGFLVRVDRIADIAMRELQPIWNALEGLGSRCGPDANPADPGLAARVIDAAVDALVRQLAHKPTELQREAESAA